MLFQPIHATAAARKSWELYLELEQSQWRSPAEIEHGQLERLRRLLQHCHEFSPHIAESLRSHDVNVNQIRSREDVSRLPIMTRREYQTHFDQIVTTALPAGVCAGEVLSTSGTSGVPIQVRQTDEMQRWWSALALRDLDWCGIDPQGRLAAIRATGMQGHELELLKAGVSLPNWGKPLSDIVATGTSHLIDVHQDPRRQLEWLVRVDPDYLLSYPSNLAYLAQLILDNGVNLSRLKIIQSVSEALTTEQQRLIETAFRVPVKNIYSAYEAGYIATPCPTSDCLHVHAENVLLEVLDEEDQPCRPGDSGRVVLTALHNFSSPIIRYEIMDEATVGPTQCNCGRGLPTLRTVSGKRRPMMPLANGSVKNSTQLAIGLRKIGGARQFQIQQTAINRLTIRIIPNSAWSSEHLDQIQQLADEFFEASVEVLIELCDQIALTSGGKLIDVIALASITP